LVGKRNTPDGAYAVIKERKKERTNPVISNGVCQWSEFRYKSGEKSDHRLASDKIKAGV
jgi:hypothetical protein